MPLCMILVVAAATIVASLRTSYFQVQAILTVPPSGGPSNATKTPPGTLATTYAQLITQDDGVTAAAAQATGLSPSVVRSRLTTAQEPNTSIITVAFSDTNAHRAAVGDAAVIRAVAGRQRSARSIPAGALLIVRAPEAARQQRRAVPGGPVPIGIVLGLILGIATFIAWNRHDPWADDPETIAADLDVPVTVLHEGSEDVPNDAVRERWRSLAGSPPPVEVALVSAMAGSGATTKRVASRMASIAGDAEPSLVFTSSTGGSDQADVNAVRADLVIIVVAQGDRVRELRRTVRTLRELDAPPSWALFVRER